MAKKSGTRDEEKRRRRMERKAAEVAARRAAERRARLRFWGITALAVVAIGAAVFFFTRPEEEVEGVEKPANRGRDHVTPGQSIGYDTATPASGPHWSQAPRCGVYSEPLELELAVHALEHGVVVIWHQPGLADDEVAALGRIARQWDSHVIVAPNSGLEQPVVATAWRRLKAFDGPGPDVEEFVDVYRRRGPERVDCPM